MRSLRPRIHWNIARRFLLSQMLVVVLVCGVVAAALYWQAQAAARDRAGEITRTLTTSLVRDPYVVERLQSADPSEGLQDYAHGITENSSVSFITIMSPDGVRYTHENPGSIGLPYQGEIAGAQAGRIETLEERGTLGVSMRTIAPVTGPDGTVIGLVSTGVTINEISTIVREQVPLLGLIAATLLATTTASTILIFRYLSRATLGFSREDILQAEATRSLAAALRSQNHEHRNRMHTVLTLLELGHVDRARRFAEADIASGTSWEADLAAGDQLPAVAALLTGKKAEAGERGVEIGVGVGGSWRAVPLTDVELVSVVGNLVDNAMDAVCENPPGEPREVEVDLSETDAGWEVVVADSGPGIPPGAETRIFEWGYSSKPAGDAGRGVGLHLLREMIERRGGTVEAANDAGAVFTVRIPRPDRPGAPRPDAETPGARR
ncbi:ATP-binding protein [Rothia sp. AR01]|uniref:histidine kinase n=1 Tax=Rothia santali TaxID=2949643 RepID=A0A9X2HJA5_9MICC|nr:ATP-binding protein [Rothia santali]MCP3425293.1 ATP-binding protein [Rothia santali]